jgi:hypothetical protein
MTEGRTAPLAFVTTPSMRTLPQQRRLTVHRATWLVMRREERRDKDEQRQLV